MLSISQIRASGGPFDLIERDGEDPRTLPFLDRRAAPVLLLRERQRSGVVDERRAGHAVRGSPYIAVMPQPRQSLALHFCDSHGNRHAPLFHGTSSTLPIFLRS